MIEITLGGCLVAVGIGLMVEKCKVAELNRENTALKKRLYAARVKVKQEALAARADANTDIAALQMNAFHQSEMICELREQLAQKDKLLRQKWTDARRE